MKVRSNVVMAVKQWKKMPIMKKLKSSFSFQPNVGWIGKRSLSFPHYSHFISIVCHRNWFLEFYSAPFASVHLIKRSGFKLQMLSFVWSELRVYSRYLARALVLLRFSGNYTMHACFSMHGI